MQWSAADPSQKEVSALDVPKLQQKHNRQKTLTTAVGSAISRGRTLHSGLHRWPDY